MKTFRPASSPPIPSETLLTDYEHWLAFVTDARQTLRQYDRQLARISERYPDLSPLSNYLRSRMHCRTQFFGQLAIQLTATVAQLRTDRSDADLLQRLRYAYPAMQTLVDELAPALVDIRASYQTLLAPYSVVGSTPSIPFHQTNPARS